MIKRCKTNKNLKKHMCVEQKQHAQDYWKHIPKARSYLGYQVLM